jgi:hypothetical protein
MGILKHKVFVVASFIFILHQVIQKIGNIHIPLLHAYLDDLLCMPVILSLTLYIFRKFVLNNPSFRFSGQQVIWAVIYFSMMFEIFLPQYSDEYVADSFDVIAYAIGALIFHYTINSQKTSIVLKN